MIVRILSPFSYQSSFWAVSQQHSEKRPYITQESNLVVVLMFMRH